MHVQVPDGVKPGEKFFVVVDDMEYEVWAPEGSSPGEMVAMDVYKDPVESQKALTASRESGKSRRKGTNTSEPESVATDGSLVYVQIPDGSGPGETFFTDVNGFEYEILGPIHLPIRRLNLLGSASQANHGQICGSGELPGSVALWRAINLHGFERSL